MTYEQPHLHLEAVFSFGGCGLYLAGAVLGRNIEVGRIGSKVTISLPKPDEVFSLVDDPGRGRRARRAWGSSEGETWAATVSQFEVRVQVTRQDDEPFSALFARAFPLALETVELFIAWMRTRAGQYWLPAWHEVLESTRPSRGKLVAAGTDEEIADPAATWVPGVTAFGRSLEQAARPEAVDDVVLKLEANEEPPGENVLLADAQAVLRNPQSARRDTVHAVLLAAVAAEIKIKRTLLENARSVLDTALENPRELSVAVGQLLNKPMKAAVGVSLMDQRHSLYVEVTETLFPLRNRVAHRGYRPTSAEADDALNIVINLFDWFDRL